MNPITFLKGAVIGAGFMYLFDPSQGRRRRALIRDRAVHVWNDAGDAVEAKTRHFANKAQGAIHDAATVLSPRGPSLLKSTAASSQAWMPANWSPTTRLLVTAGAGLLALYGKRRGDMLGTAIGALSVGVITNTVNVRELRHGIGAAPALPSDYAESEEGDTPFGSARQEHLPRAARKY